MQEELSDAALVKLVLQDDSAAFSVLLERYQPLAFALALRQVLQLETAQDLVQEAILQTYLSLDQLRDSTRFKSWFYGLVLNVCRNWRRRNSVQHLSFDLWEEYQPFYMSSDPYELIEEEELRCAVQQAMQALSPKNQSAMFCFYYEELSLGEIATRLHLTQTAVKSRLYEGRNQLKKQLVTTYPELSLGSWNRRKKKKMIEMQLMNAIPQEQRTLILLHDQAGQRVLPLWLNSLESYPLVALQKRSSRPERAGDPTTIDFVGNLLQATAATVKAVQLEALEEQMLYGRVLLEGPNGAQQIKARLGDALALVVRERCPLEVAEELLKRHGQKLPAVPGQTVEQRLEEFVRGQLARASKVAGLPPPRRIKQPQNLSFAEGLQRWELRGTFLHDQSGANWQDYASGTEASGPQGGWQSGYLKAQVPEPTGSADLRQAILADDYRRCHLRLSAAIKTQGVEQQAGLYLRIVDPGRTRTSEEREQVTFQGTQEWTRYETQIEAPGDAVFVLFGISLTGPGQVWLTDVRLEKG